MSRIKIAILTAITLLWMLPVDAQRLGPGESPESKEKKTFQKDTIAKHIKKWQLENDVTIADSAIIDTTLRKLDIYREVYKASLFNHYLGNIGLGAMPMHFFDRPQHSRFLFSRYYTPYLQNADNMYFYNTTKPYTVLNYTTSTRARDKQTIEALHTQNVTPALNVALLLQGHKSEGPYNRQNSGKRSYGLSANFMQKHYMLHASLNHTRLDNMENGGMTLDLSDPNDPLFTPNLNSANTSYFRQSAMLAQTLKIGNLNNIPDSINQGLRESWLDISHKFSMERQAYLYKEKQASVNEYYNQVFFDTTATYDSTFHSEFSNALQVKFSEKWNRYFPVGIKFGIEHAVEKYYNFKNFLETRAVDNFTNVKVSAGAFNRVSKHYQWRARAIYHASGYRENDWRLKGHIKLQLLENTFPLHIEAKGVYKQITPGYFKQQYYSNHSIWNKTLKKENHQLIQAKLQMPQINTTVGFNTGRHKHYTYFDTAATPRQYEHPLSVISLELKQEFQAGHFHYDHRVLWQRSDANKILHLPEFAYFGSLYYQREYFDVLNTQIGINLEYRTSYYLPGYDPATSQFHLSYSEKSGNTPLAAFYANARWKRTLLFIKLAQLNALLYDDTEYYYTVKQYPMPPMTFTFGVSWKFYD